MKIKHRPILCFAALSTTTLVAPVAVSQVVIEGGPGVIQLSDQDGRPEPANSAPVNAPASAVVPAPPQTTPPAGLFQGNSRVRSMDLQVPADPNVTVSVPIVTPAPEPSVAPGAAAPGAAAPANPEVNVDVARRRAELVRAVGLNDSGTGAAGAFFTENFYEPDLAVVSSAAGDTMAQLAEFLRLTPHTEIAVTYHYAPTLHNEELAWQRALSAVEWLKTRGGLAASNFVVRNPEIVTTPTPTPAEDDGDLAVLRNRISFVITYR